MSADVLPIALLALLLFIAFALARISDDLRMIRKSAKPTVVNVTAAKVSPEDEKSIRDAIRRAAQ